jgi:hypothetical protein
MDQPRDGRKQMVLPADLEPEERVFLVSQKIKPDQVLDARGLTKDQWTRRANDEELLFIYGSPCEAKGHRLRTRSGHCIQCDTSKIGFIRRHSGLGYVYIAASKAAQLLKVGSCVDIGQRERNLCLHRYGGSSDWKVIASAKMPAMGAVEFDIQKALKDLEVEGSYEKDGRTQRTRELLNGDLVKVWQAFNVRTEKSEKRWKHPGFANFNFAKASGSKPTR